MSATAHRCGGALDHRPLYAETDKHHVFPKYLAALLGIPAVTVTIDLCSGCHDLTHHLIRHLINEGVVEGHHAPRRVTALAREAYSWWTANLLYGGPP